MSHQGPISHTHWSLLEKYLQELKAPIFRIMKTFYKKNEEILGMESEK